MVVLGIAVLNELMNGALVEEDSVEVPVLGPELVVKSPLVLEETKLSVVPNEPVVSCVVVDHFELVDADDVEEDFVDEVLLDDVNVVPRDVIGFLVVVLFLPPPW